MLTSLKYKEVPAGGEGFVDIQLRARTANNGSVSVYGLDIRIHMPYTASIIVLSEM